MAPGRIEPEWLDAFEAVLRGCALHGGDTVAVLHESGGRSDLPELASSPGATVPLTRSGTSATA